MATEMGETSHQEKLGVRQEAGEFAACRRLHDIHFDFLQYVCRPHDVFFFSSRRRHTRFDCDWSSDVCSSDLADTNDAAVAAAEAQVTQAAAQVQQKQAAVTVAQTNLDYTTIHAPIDGTVIARDRKSVV